MPALTSSFLPSSGLEAADLRNVWDTVRQKVAGSAVACVIATVTEKGTARAARRRLPMRLLAAGFQCGATLSRRSHRSSTVGGGGRPAMAQAGGKDAAGLSDALARGLSRNGDPGNETWSLLRLDIGETQDRYRRYPIAPAPWPCRLRCMNAHEVVSTLLGLSACLLEDYEPDVLVCGLPHTMAGEEEPSGR